MKIYNFYLSLIAVVLTLFLLPGILHAKVPVRFSVKFILDDTNLPGDPPCCRPTCCDMFMDEQLIEQVATGNEKLRALISELGIEVVEIIDVPGISAFFNADPSGDMTALRNAARANPGLYEWRTNALNVYISGKNDSAAAGIPQWSGYNDIMIIAQNIYPTTVVHETGHTLSLWHTHTSSGTDGGDDCSDTILDNSTWDQDDIAQNNFGNTYNNLSQAQKNQVDTVWFNIMSYHNINDTGQERYRMSLCQMDRESTQGYTDRNWLLSKVPIYVNSNYSGSPQNGSFENPYPALQDALSAGNYNGKVIVLQQGSYSTTDIRIPVSQSNWVDIATRIGTSTVVKQDEPPPYNLPVLEQSKSLEVIKAIKKAKAEDANARNVMKAGKKNAKLTATKEERDAVLADAEGKKKQHSDDAIKHMLQAEKFATDKEKIAVQLGLAQRYKYSGNCKDAIKYFNKVAAATKQKYLRDRSLRDVDDLSSKCQESKKD